LEGVSLAHRLVKIPLLLLAVGLLETSADWAAPPPDAGTFHGTVYQVDTVYNFVDVIMPGGTKRFYAGPATIVRVHRKRAALIDIAMGEEVQGTYRMDSKGVSTAVSINDLTAR
jgi:hypothetical protein